MRRKQKLLGIKTAEEATMAFLVQFWSGEGDEDGGLEGAMNEC